MFGWPTAGEEENGLLTDCSERGRDGIVLSCDYTIECFGDITKLCALLPTSFVQHVTAVLHSTLLFIEISHWHWHKKQYKLTIQTM